MEKIYYDLETKRFIKETEVRLILILREVDELYNTNEDRYDIKYLKDKVNSIKEAAYNDIIDVVRILDKKWNRKIKIYKEMC